MFTAAVPMDHRVSLSSRGVPVTAIRKNGRGSEIVCGKTEKGGAVQ